MRCKYVNELVMDCGEGEACFTLGKDYTFYTHYMGVGYGFFIDDAHEPHYFKTAELSPYFEAIQ